MSWLNSPANWLSSSPPRILTRWLYSPLPYDPDGPQQVADPSGEGLEKTMLIMSTHHTDDDGNGTQVALDIGEQPRLVGVVFIDIDRADGDALVHERAWRPCCEKAPSRYSEAATSYPFSAAVTSLSRA